MGYGCNKNKNNKIDEANRIRIASEKKKVEALKKGNNIVSKLYDAEKAARKKLVEKKIKFCKNCLQSTPTREERRSRQRVCHKCNKSIQEIINDKNFKCPIDNF
mgnify:CR=1 FL=1